MFSFPEILAVWRISILRIIPVESIGIHRSSGCGSNFNSASMAQVSHGPHPGIRNIMKLAQSHDWFRYGRIGIFGQVDSTGFAGLKGFSELLGSYNHSFTGYFMRNIRICHRFITNNVHTVYYYKHFFEKFNKN